MATTIQYITGDRASGRTTIAAALLRGYLAMDIPALYIAPTQELAARFAKRYAFLPCHCGTLRDLDGRTPQAIILDGVSRMDHREGPPTERAFFRLETHTVPTQIFVIE